ncbi:MAG: hypothetical protein CYPHOPRED_001316 [Cyphobasidiales sp. Tagirdzhanova-0007]|nr:MAG: hypothetical protein CYPHOPRED_001316 [Cyphobasidiales sp. Tagirdzhanova-0007]
MAPLRLNTSFAAVADYEAITPTQGNVKLGLGSDLSIFDAFMPCPAYHNQDYTHTPSQHSAPPAPPISNYPLDVFAHQQPQPHSAPPLQPQQHQPIIPQSYPTHFYQGYSADLDLGFSSASDTASTGPGTPPSRNSPQATYPYPYHLHHQQQQQPFMPSYPGPGQGIWEPIYPAPNAVNSIEHDQHLPAGSPDCNSHYYSSDESVHTTNSEVSSGRGVRSAKRGLSASPADEAISGGRGKRFLCSYPGCSRTFSRNFNLSTHYNTHLGIKPFGCSYCPKSFSRRHDCARHIAAVHTATAPGVTQHKAKATSASCKCTCSVDHHGSAMHAPMSAMAPPMAMDFVKLEDA